MMPSVRSVARFARTSLASLSAALALASAAPASAQQRPAQPPQQAASTVKVAPETVDLGIVAPGSTNPATFVLVNQGTTTVVVRGATPSCKCTAISGVIGKSIPPGGTLELSAALSAPRVPGTKDAKVLLAFDGAAPAVATIKGEVRLPVLAEPPYVDALRDVVSGSVRLRSLDGKPFRVLRSGGRAGPVEPAPGFDLAWSLAGKACEEMPLWWFVFTDREDCAVIPLRVRDECTGSKHDMARYQRFWIVKESLVLPEVGTVGVAGAVKVELEHYNPPRRGQVERRDWSEVRSVRVLPAPDGAVLADAKAVSTVAAPGDEAVLTVALTPRVAGPIEGELEITTATGTGRVPFAMVARPAPAATTPAPASVP
jgi:hypothetical protein